MHRTGIARARLRRCQYIRRRRLHRERNARAVAPIFQGFWGSSSDYRDYGRGTRASNAHRLERTCGFCQVLLRRSLKLCHTASRTKVIHLPVVFRASRCARGVDTHSANRIAFTNCGRLAHCGGHKICAQPNYVTCRALETAIPRNARATARDSKTGDVTGGQARGDINPRRLSSATRLRHRLA